MDDKKQPMTEAEIETVKKAVKQEFIRQAQHLEADYSRERLELQNRFHEQLNELEARRTEARTPDAEPRA